MGEMQPYSSEWPEWQHCPMVEDEPLALQWHFSNQTPQPPGPRQHRQEGRNKYPSKGLSAPINMNYRASPNSME